MWRQAEELGFAHAWTYDHLVWAGLPDAPWFGTTPTLTAAALVTKSIRLGTFVTSPNYRHPVTLMRDLLALDDISGGRIICGMGAGGDRDALILGGPVLSARERVDRLAEFADLLDRLLREDHIEADGRWFSTRDARTLPGCVQRPRIPFVVAANGPRSMRIAARHGAGWLTNGRPADEPGTWWAGVAELAVRFADLPGTEGMDRYLSLDNSPQFSLSSIGVFDELVGRAEQLGFTDVIVHWPRPDGPYAGDPAILDEVATRLG